MPYSRFHNSEIHPYHVTNRCINKDWFAMPLVSVWEILSRNLHFTTNAFDLIVHAFILMSNHYHLLVSSPKANLSEALNYFQAHSSLEIVKSADRINHLWARRFKRCEIKSNHNLMNAYKYIYRNPVRAQMCSQVEEYPYGTLRGLLGFERLRIPVEDSILFANSVETLRWLNTPSRSEDESDIRKALRRQEFQLARRRGQKNPLENERI